MSRIEELREPVRPIAEKFRNWGFSVTDVTSIGLLSIKDWDANRIAKYRELLAAAESTADSVVSAAEADLKERSQKKGRPRSKSG